VEGRGEVVFLKIFVKWLNYVNFRNTALSVMGRCHAVRSISACDSCEDFVTAVAILVLLRCRVRFVRVLVLARRTIFNQIEQQQQES
jgi:hypothetical protein